MTTTPPELAAGLAARAVHTARAYRAADPHGFHRRHDDPDQWNRWARRARVARTIAAALNVPVGSVLVTDDPHRAYRTRTGPVPGDLITVIDPTTERAWRFISDVTAPGEGWLLLDRCPGCEAEVPITRIACLVDLGDYLDPDSDLRIADEARDAAPHQPGCAFASPTVGDDSKPTPEPHPTDTPRTRIPKEDIVPSNPTFRTHPTDHTHLGLPPDAVVLVPAPPDAVPMRPPAGAWGLVVVAVRTAPTAGVPVRLVGDVPAADPTRTDTAAMMAGRWLAAPSPADVQRRLGR